MSSVSDTSATLAFTQVGDGLGGAASYQVGYATSPVTPGNAISVSRGTCTPPIAGTTVGSPLTCTVFGLTSGTTYYFQMAAFRGTFNVNAVYGGGSNMPSGTTALTPVNTVIVTPPSGNGSVGSGVAFTVALKDIHNNTIAGWPVTWTSSNPAVATVDNSGMVTGIGAGTATITATAGGKSGSSAVVEAALPPPPSGNSGSVVITTQPGNGTSGLALVTKPVVQLRDASGVLMATSTAAVTATLNGAGTLSGTTTVNAVAGIATFSNLIITGSGSFTLTFSTSGLASANSNSFSVASTPATKLAIAQQPAGAASGAAFATQPIVQIRDVNHNLVSSSTATVNAVATGPGTLSGTTSVTAVGGVATFTNLALSSSGSYTLTFSSTGLTSVTSGTITVTGPSITSLSRDGGSSAGGAQIVVNGVGFGSDAVVKFGGTTATVTSITPTAINAVAPPGTATNPIAPVAVAVTVTTGGTTATLANPWTYWPAPTNVLGAADFENGTYGTGGLGPCCTPAGGDAISISTDQAHSGTHSVKQVVMSTAQNDVAFGGGWVQSDIVGGAGRWHRWYMFAPAATMASVANNGQIKLFLSRTGVSNHFVVLATGPETLDPAQEGANVLGALIDQFNYHLNDNYNFHPQDNVGITPTITSGVWHEIQVYEYRDPVASIGHAKVWFDGKLIANSDAPQIIAAGHDSMLGDNDPTLVR